MPCKPTVFVCQFVYVGNGFLTFQGECVPVYPLLGLINGKIKYKMSILTLILMFFTFLTKKCYLISVYSRREVLPTNHTSCSWGFTYTSSTASGPPSPQRGRLSEFVNWTEFPILYSLISNHYVCMFVF